MHPLAAVLAETSPVAAVAHGLGSDDVLQQVSGLTPLQSLGIPIALLGAVFMSLGAIYQHRGVTKVEAASRHEAAHGLSPRHLVRLLTRPSWIAGTVMLGLAILLQLTSLALAPLVIVQPLGVVSLVITTLVTARQIRIPLSPQKWLAVGMCVVGVGAFVTVAGFYSVQVVIVEWQIVTVLLVMVAVIGVYALLFALFRRKSKALFYIVGAGVIYGFVATLAKITINRVQHGNVEWLTLICIAGILIGTAAGAYFVQTAYASGPPDMVIAGLTVIDPLVAVVIGVSVLLEVNGAPWFTYVLFIIFGALAVAGVVVLERGQTMAELDATKKRALGRSATERDPGTG
ncbi:DMT family transporter [Pseudoclavibacter endophyticus]|uniref:DMT family transporter n=1 Tax=Pseudoclavibacter endophyticus TaxID=1778590 RepID=UPI001CE3D371|nr:DMT family transporter [Pseudoclavibacter endophyticus]